MTCADCGAPATHYCEGCKQPVCENESQLCVLFLHNWRELTETEKTHTNA